MAQFDPALRGIPIHFRMANEWVRNTAIMHHLKANGVTTHVFQALADNLGKSPALND